MKYIVVLLLAAAPWLTDPAKISRINSAKAEAKKAFNSGDYKTAIAKYKYLIDSLGVNEEEVQLNLANAYYQEKDTANASTNYQALSSSLNNKIRSKAYQQLGVIANQQGKSEQALNDFKQAIKANPSNEDARYNYEMLKKKLDEKKKQEQQDKQDNKDKSKDQKKEDQEKEDQKKDQQNKDQEKKDEQRKEQEKKEQEKKEQEEKQKEQQKNDQQKKDEQKKKGEKENQEQQPQDQQDKKKEDMPNLDREKLQQMKISEEKAKMILEAMKNQEKQYLQQQKRKATKSRDRNKPDW